MRVLLTCQVFPPDLGGPGIYVAHVGRWLAERGHEVEVVAFCSDPRPSGHPFRVVAIPPGFWPLRYLKAFFLVWREARGRDVVYVQEHLALFHVLAARLAGVPAVIRVMVDGAWEISTRRGWIGGDDHDAFQGKRYGLRVALFRRMQRWWWDRVERIVTCSEYLRGILIRHYGQAPEKVRTIYNAYNGPSRADFPQTRAEARRAVGIAPDRRWLLTVCRLVEWKGVDTVMRALRELPADVDFLVAGDGPMRAEWERLAGELGLAHRVHFLGNVPHERVPLFVRAADVFVLASEYEGLSHTLLEVSALGTPIVASAVCGNPEVVRDGETGLTVPPRDPGALARALERMLADLELRARCVEAAHAATARFRRDTTYAEVERLLAEVAGAPPLAAAPNAAETAAAGLAPAADNPAAGAVERRSDVEERPA